MISNEKIERNGNPSPALRGRDMICFGHDWKGDPLSKTHLMRLFARENRVLWINSIGYRTPTVSARDFRRAAHKLKSAAQPVKEVERNIFVLNPFAVPAYGIPFIREVNRQLLRRQIFRAMRRLKFERPINWVFTPTASVVAGSLNEDLLVYYCVDDFTAFSDAGNRTMIKLEDKLIRRADLVIVSAETLYRSKGGRNPNTVLVRHGVDYQHFRKALHPEIELPGDLAGLPRPVIGYFGLMAADWIDIDLLEHVARSFPEASLVLLGSVTTDVSRLAALPNVHLLGRKPFGELPAYCKGFDVAILPFPLNEVTRNSNPLKVREYLAAGLPVVSTRIPEVEVLGLARIADNKEEFVAQIRDALAAPGPDSKLSDLMQGESWEGRVKEVERHIGAVRSRSSLNAPA